MDNFIEGFNNKSTGMSYYDDVIKDPKYGERKNRYVKVINMSPKAYIEACVEGFNTNKQISNYDGEPTTYDSLVDSRTDDSLENLKIKMNSESIDMPVLEYQVRSNDYIYFTQEGIHRAIAALQLGYDKIPVLLCISRDYNAEDYIDQTELKMTLEFFTKKLNENYKDITIPKLLEKLKKIVIEPQEKILFDDMEDQTGMNIVDECEGGSASLGTAPTPSFAQVKVNGKPVPGKSSKKKKIEESKTICKIIKSFKDSEGEIHNDVLFEGSKDDCLKYASNNNLETSLYNSRKLGRRPQYFIREFDVYSYDRSDKSALKRNQAIIANSMIGESLKIAISEIDALYEDFNNNIDEVVISWLNKHNFKNIKSEKGFVYINKSGNYIHYIIFNKPNSIRYQVKNNANEILFNETWQVSNIEDAEDLFNNIITKKFKSFE